MTVRVGFVGCGLIAGFHAAGLAPVPDAEITAVFDVDDARRRRFADAQAARAVASVDELIDAVDAVYVTTWTAAHPEVVDAVVDAGLPVFCEKPLGVDLAAAQAMAARVRAAGVVNQVGLVLRSSPAFRWLREQVHSGRHGAPMSMVFRDDQYLPTRGMYASTWRGDPALAGSGALLEHSIHDLDLIEWILGDVVSVNAVTAFAHDIDGIEDQASVILRTAEGAQAVLSSTWHDIDSRPSQRSVEVFCRTGHFAVDGDWFGPVRRQTSDDEDLVLDGHDLVDAIRPIDGVDGNPDADFVHAVQTGQAAHPDFAVAVRAHVLADAAYRSAAAGGAPVDVRVTRSDERPPTG
ncbi:MAG: Gfo/Idh/MocA family oxidoreductase [Acidimicrobiales bacterium]|nr:Gfo/Idh/MocA family oxidoreductase [Acidimicrobiales bacterium]